LEAPATTVGPPRLEPRPNRLGAGCSAIELWARRVIVSAARSRSRFQEAPELLGARRMTELAQRLGLDLPDPFSGDGKILSDFFERVLAAVREAEAQPQDLFLAGRERVEDLVRLLAQGQADDRLDGRDDLLVLYKIAEVTVLFLSDGCFQRN